jgi:hypothetical protein
MNLLETAFINALSPEERAAEEAEKERLLNQQAKEAVALAFRKAAENMRLTRADIGRPISQRGIYLGKWRPMDEKRQSVGQKYYVFMAFSDWVGRNGQDRFSYNELVGEVGRIKDWAGHPGHFVEQAGTLHDDLGSGKYGGGWFLPPAELLNGTNFYRARGFPTNVSELQNNGRLNAVFQNCPYWTCSHHPREASETMIVDIRVPDEADFHRRDSLRLPCRLFRLEPAP